MAANPQAFQPTSVDFQAPSPVEIPTLVDGSWEFERDQTSGAACGAAYRPRPDHGVAHRGLSLINALRALIDAPGAVGLLRRPASPRDPAGCIPIATLPIPLFDIDTLLQPLRERLREAAIRTLDAGTFILGPEVDAFEREFASYLGVKHVIGVANGTDAITIGLRAMGVGPGDEVIVPSFTFYASAEAIPPTGARPVFCDVDPETMMVTPETVKPALTPATKAVVAVHLFGNVAPVTGIEALGVPVLEDSAQAAGSRGPNGRPGALGTAATFSFYPSKNLGCLGDGGAIATSNDEVAGMARILRFHGSRDRANWEFIGYNSRLDELQAAFLRVLLPELDEWSRRRTQAAHYYRDAGLDSLVTLPSATDGAAPAWHLYVIRSQYVDEIAAALSEAGIGNKVYYRPPIHRHVAMVPFAQGVELSVTDKLALTHLAIPIGPGLTPVDAAEVTRCIENVILARVHGRSATLPL